MMAIPLCLLGQEPVVKEPVACNFQLKKSDNKDKWLGKDKARHLVGCFILSGVLYWKARYRHKLSQQESICSGVGITLSLGALKEIWDSRHPGSWFSWKDMAANLLGSFLGVLFISGWQ